LGVAPAASSLDSHRGTLRCAHRFAGRRGRDLDAARGIAIGIALGALCWMAVLALATLLCAPHG
jgi:hypothetical protein